MYKKFNWLMDLLFPPHCVFCNRVVPVGKQICESCHQEVKQINSVKRIKLPNCGNTIPCAVPYSYQGKVRNSILQFKFYGKKQYASFYAAKMAVLIMESFSTLHIDIITCVPISQKRQKNRGYNQSELLASELVKLLSLPYVPSLIKKTDNKEQHKLSMRERKKNVKGVYEVIDSNFINGKTVLLIDDIVTTGATLSECAKELFQANAKEVICAAIAEVMI